MICATVSAQSCFCWPYRASPSLAAKNIISLILALTIWWCPCAESSLVLLEEGVCYDPCFLLTKLYFCPASFCTPRPNLPVTPGVSWLPTFVFQYWNAVIGCNLKNDRMISVRFQGKPFSITVIPVYVPTNNIEEAEVERFYEDLQDLQELIAKNDVLFIIGD